MSVLCVSEQRECPILEQMVLGTTCLGEEPLCQLLKVAAVVHLNLCLLSEEVLQVLQQLHPQLTLLVQTLQLLHQLGTDLCRDEGKRRDRETEMSLTS